MAGRPWVAPMEGGESAQDYILRQFEQAGPAAHLSMVQCRRCWCLVTEEKRLAHFAAAHQFRLL